MSDFLGFNRNHFAAAAGGIAGFTAGFGMSIMIGLAATYFGLVAATLPAAINWVQIALPLFVMFFATRGLNHEGKYAAAFGVGAALMALPGGMAGLFL